MKKSSPQVQLAQMQLLAAYGRFFLNITNLRYFLETAHVALVKNCDAHKEVWIEAAQKSASKDHYQAFIEAHLKTMPQGFLEDFPIAMADRSMRIARQTVDSSAIVFAHSILDGLLTECCQISFNASPKDWIPFVKERKVEIKHIFTHPAKKLAQKAANDFVNQLGRESMAKRIDFLHQVCAPKINSSKLPTSSIDKSKLASFDLLRQRIVHGKSFSRKIDDAASYVDLTAQVGFAFLLLVSESYKLLKNQDTSAISHLRILRWFAAIKKEFPEFLKIYEKHSASGSIMHKLFERKNNGSTN